MCIFEEIHLLQANLYLLWGIINIIVVNIRFSKNEGDQFYIKIPLQAFAKVSNATKVILLSSFLFNSILYVLQVILYGVPQIVKNIWITSEQPQAFKLLKI